jgi:hypothetical protein
MRIVAAMPYGLLTALLVGCGPSEHEQLEANKALVRQFAASIDAGDWAALDTLVATDIQRHSRATTADPEIRGARGVQATRAGAAYSVAGRACYI